MLSANKTEDGVKLVLMIANYNAQYLGEIHMSAKEDLELANAAHVIGVAAEYVELDEETKEKSILVASASTTVTTYIEPDEWTLIDLSNLIDVFGMTSNDPDWTFWQYYDFNNSGDIDIYDIVYVAQRIQ